jgi:Uma2 family endonuclease
MSSTVEQPPPPRIKRWTKQEYYDLTEHFHGQQIELFRGELVEKFPEPGAPRVKYWTKAEYLKLIDHFHGQRVYLFRGELIEMSPQYHPHTFAVTELDDELRLVFGTRQGFKVRIQMPFDTLGDSMPEPDVVLCTEAQHLREPHPSEALLIVEVADSSLALDRKKALEYAAAKVPEYWIVDVQNRRVEVYRNPVPDPTTPLGFRYLPPSIVEAGGTIEPLAKPGAAVVVASLFRS